MDTYDTHHSSAISLENVPTDKVERYAIISGKKNSQYNIREPVEKPTKNKAPPPNLAIITHHVPTPDIFDKISKTEPELEVKFI